MYVCVSVKASVFRCAGVCVCTVCVPVCVCVRVCVCVLCVCASVCVCVFAICLPLLCETQKREIASLPKPETPIGPTSGEVTQRFNIKPLISRWTGDLVGKLPKSHNRKRNKPETPLEDDFVPPKRRGGRAVLGTKDPIPISSDTDSGRRTPPSKSQLTREKKENLALKTTQGLQKAKIKVLERDLAKMTTKYDKAQADLVKSLGDEVGGRRESEKRAAAADKDMREMVTQYHTKVLGELDKISEVLKVMRSTPVEIIATQEVRHQPLQPYDTTSVQGQQSLTPTIQHAGTSSSFLAPSSTFRSSPSREAQNNQHQQHPTFERPYLNAPSTLHSSPNRELQHQIQRHPPQMFERAYLNPYHQDAWKSGQFIPRSSPSDNTGESDGIQTRS